MKACHETPSQNIKTINPPKQISSLEVRSAGIVLSRCDDEPNRAFIQLLKNTVGASRYNKTMNTRASRG